MTAEGSSKKEEESKFFGDKWHLILTWTGNTRERENTKP